MSMRLHVIFSVTCSLAVASGLAAQTTDAPRRPRLEGKWQAKAEDEIRHIMVRSDSSLPDGRSEEHTSELQSQSNLVCRLLLEKKKKKKTTRSTSRES